MIVSLCGMVLFAFIVNKTTLGKDDVLEIHSCARVFGESGDRHLFRLPARAREPNGVRLPHAGER